MLHRANCNKAFLKLCHYLKAFFKVCTNLIKICTYFDILKNLLFRLWMQIFQLQFSTVKYCSMIYIKVSRHQITKMNPYESDLFVKFDVVKWTKMVYQSAFRPPWVSIFSVITADRLRTNWIQFPFAATWGPWLQSYAVRPFLSNFYPMITWSIRVQLTQIWLDWFSIDV